MASGSFGVLPKAPTSTKEPSSSSALMRWRGVLRPSSSRRLRERSLPGSCACSRRADRSAIFSAVVVGLLAAVATNLLLNPVIHVLGHDANDWLIGHGEVISRQLHNFQVFYYSAPTTVWVNMRIPWLEFNRTIMHALRAEKQNRRGDIDPANEINAGQDLVIHKGCALMLQHPGSEAVLGGIRGG